MNHHIDVVTYRFAQTMTIISVRDIISKLFNHLQSELTGVPTSNT
jgi:hypothetical protein